LRDALKLAAPASVTLSWVALCNSSEVASLQDATEQCDES
jgi:hypothetical protein